MFGLLYKIIDRGVAFPYDKATNLLLIECSKVDLSMWFEFTKPLVIQPLINDEFIAWMDKIQKAKEDF